MDKGAGVTIWVNFRCEPKKNPKGTPRREFTRIICERRWFLPHLPARLGKEIDCRGRQEKTSNKAVEYQ